VCNNTHFFTPQTVRLGQLHWLRWLRELHGVVVIVSFLLYFTHLRVREIVGYVGRWRNTWTQTHVISRLELTLSHVPPLRQHELEHVLNLLFVTDIG
jgi:hypothetical protein